ncbi:MAG: class I SAM-dependent methyltransferase [Phycisphaerae bacterium]|nr:class I SAM-dependent methyltransferase [Tepidisphaeraceae bacterium]
MNDPDPQPDFKYHRLSSTPGSSHALVQSLVPRACRVLEFGCATGYMSRALRERLGCTVTGVELFPEPAEKARQYCERVIVGDIESMDFAAALGPARFDAVLFADVLEHLKDPAAVVRRVTPVLADGGAIIASIPNVAHGSVRLALLGGEWRYGPTGLLDETHLRFFTRESVQQLFEGAGYTVTHWLRSRKPIHSTEVLPPVRPVPLPVLDWIARDPEATTYQFVVRAQPAASRPADAQAAQAEADRLRAENDWLRRLYAASQDLGPVVPPGATVIVADAGEFDREFAAGWRKFPFPERDGEYWGTPADAAAAVTELERLRAAGATHIAFGWPAFWWLDHYEALHRHLRDRYPCVLENDRLIVFELK